jgi:hypothetical protein
MATVLKLAGMPAKDENLAAQVVEILDSASFAQRLGLPESWVRAHVQTRTPADDRIPCLRFGRYIRFAWGSPELNQWLANRRAR